MSKITIRAFDETDHTGIIQILKRAGWAEKYVNRQLESIRKLHNNKEGQIIVALDSEVVIGFVQIVHYKWNDLTYVLGLIVHPDYQHKGIGEDLMYQAEEYSKSMGNRGIYLDTPVSNMQARHFYESIGFKESYVMPEFYEANLDGITLQKFYTQ